MAGGERRLEGDWGLEVEGAVEADWVLEGFDGIKDHGMGAGAALSAMVVRGTKRRCCRTRRP